MKIGLEYHQERFHKDLRKLLELDVNTLKKIKEIIKSKEDISIDIEENVFLFLENTGIKVEDFYSILSVSKYIYNRAIKKDVTTEELINEIKDYSDKKNLKLSKAKTTLLGKLFDIDQITRKKKKVIPYKRRVVDIIKSISAVFDLRAVFDSQDKTKVDCFIPMIIVKIETINNENKEHEFVFQMDYENLRKIIEVLEKCKDRILKIKENYKDTINIYNIEEQTELEESIE